MDESVKIKSRDYWFKVVEMLQQNWALIDLLPDGACNVFFVGDTSGIFDEMRFDSIDEAFTSLRRNGFAKYSDDKKAQGFICPPEPPFYHRAHPNGPTYSSGRYYY